MLLNGQIERVLWSVFGEELKRTLFDTGDCTLANMLDACRAKFSDRYPLVRRQPLKRLRVMAGRADLQHPAMHRDRSGMPVALDEEGLQIDPLASREPLLFPEYRALFSRAPAQRAAG